MSSINVSFHVDGETETATGTAGDSIMSVAVRRGISGIIGECGGEMSCGTCHVVCADQDGFSPVSEEEEELLEMIDGVTEGSRLSCQLKLSDARDNIEVSVP